MSDFESQSQSDLRGSLSWILFLAILWLPAAGHGQAGDDAAPIWTFVAEVEREDVGVLGLDELDEGGSADARFAAPRKFTAYRLSNADFLSSALESVHLFDVGDDTGPRRVSLSLPMPGDSIETFVLESASVLAPEIAERHPRLRSFRGFAAEDSTTTIRVSTSAAGLHAQVLSDQGVVWIDPTDDEGGYASYRRADNLELLTPIRCQTQSTRSGPIPEMRARAARGSGEVESRTLRIAFVATGEYTQFHSRPGKPDASKGYAAMHRTLNRLAGLYEAELGITLLLVSGESVVFEDPTKDGLSNDNGRRLLDETHSVLAKQVGVQNFDIGHGLSTGAGGVATLGSACDRKTKGQGVTGAANPHGDAFDVDYVAHEIGHQLGADHTFDGERGSCGEDDNRVQSTAVEPGSGSTIMGYAGICPDGCDPVRNANGDNLQCRSHPYFHAVSLSQIGKHLAANRRCGDSRRTDNHAPTVTPSHSFAHVPTKTPFELSAEATDPDEDSLTIAWEGLTPGGPRGAPLERPDDGVMPLFRSYEPSMTTSRIFPSMETLLGFGVAGEKLPEKARSLEFQVTARDGRGGIGSERTRVQIVKTAEPFEVLDVSGPVSGALMVRWKTAGTEFRPFGHEYVNIELTRDDGRSFERIASGLPNDGRSVVVLPGSPIGGARLKIQPTDGIYFGISSRPFEVRPSNGMVVFVRHGERDENGDRLVRAGRERAEALGRLVQERPPVVILHSETSRSKETAKHVLAGVRQGRFDLEIPLDEYLQKDAAAVNARRAQLKGEEWMLVIAHSHTMNMLVEVLGEAVDPDELHRATPEFEANEYDRLVVLRREAASQKLDLLRY